MNNLWVKDRKIVFRELYSTYIEEGYSSKEAKRLAKQQRTEPGAVDKQVTLHGRAVFHHEFPDSAILVLYHTGDGIRYMPDTVLLRIVFQVDT